MNRNQQPGSSLDAPDERTSYNDLESVFFGMDPGEWACLLVNGLVVSSGQLDHARRHLADERRDTTDAIEAQAVADVRAKAVQLLANLVATLEAMPIVQSVADATCGLRYLLTSLYDVERGSAPAWLVAKSTKSHPERASSEVEWMHVVICVQLLRLLPEYNSENKAAKKISEDTGRALSSVKRWCDRLHHPLKHKNAAARQEIETEVMQIRAIMAIAANPSVVWRRISELLP